MPRVVIDWRDNCPKCDYVKKIFALSIVDTRVNVLLLNGMEPDKQVFLKKHDINSVPVVLFYNSEGQVTRATKHTARGLDADFYRHVGFHLFPFFA